MSTRESRLRNYGGAVGSGRKSRSCLTASGQPPGKACFSKVSDRSPPWNRRTPRPAPPRTEAGSSAPHIGGGPERPRFLESPLTAPRQLIVVLVYPETAGIVSTSSGATVTAWCGRAL